MRLTGFAKGFIIGVVIGIVLAGLMLGQNPFELDPLKRLGR